MLHGLIYQARPRQFTHGFDKSNREASTIELKKVTGKTASEKIHIDILPVMV
jgi:hypothetical protein